MNAKQLCGCSCGCEESATSTDDADVAVCEDCADYYCDESGEVVCSRMQDRETCRDCGDAIMWSRIQTAQPGVANRRDGRCSCREWTETEHGPGNWALSEAPEVAR